MSNRARIMEMRGAMESAIAWVAGMRMVTAWNAATAVTAPDPPIGRAEPRNALIVMTVQTAIANREVAIWTPRTGKGILAEGMMATHAGIAEGMGTRTAGRRTVSRG